MLFEKSFLFPIIDIVIKDIHIYILTYTRGRLIHEYIRYNKSLALHVLDLYCIHENAGIISSYPLKMHP